MARCPFADQSHPGTSSGRYLGGPWHIVHHTTEGDTAAGAIATYHARNLWPTFTVAEEVIYQHLDTSIACSALMNLAGGVETNRLSAIQLELVGHAGRAKSPKALKNVARLCRWLEEQHNIPPAWPNGPPRFGSSDPGGHNRSVANWVSKAGHYGHSQTPENRHWDPGYRPDELAIVMSGAAPAALEPGRCFVQINGFDQTQRVKSWVEGGNSVGDYTDLWDYFGWEPAPRYDPVTNTLYLITPAGRPPGSG